MLVIRLARGGRAKYPTYRIVAAESSRAVTGKFVEVLGHYNPHTKELVIKKEETIKRISNGAQPSNSVVKLLQREKITLPEWVKLKTKTRKPKKEPEVKAEAAPAATEEAPTEEVAEDTTTEAPVVEAAAKNADEISENKPSEDVTETADETAKNAEASQAASDAAAENAEETAKDS